MNRLTVWGQQVLEDLRENRPATAKALERLRCLEQVADNVQRMATQELAALVSEQGVPYNQALEQVFWKLLRVPTQAEEPATPERFLPPDSRAPSFR